MMRDTRWALLFLALAFAPTPAGADGARYATQDQAAYAALRAASGAAMSHRLDHGGGAVELGGLIYRDADGHYGFTRPGVGDAHAVEPGFDRVTNRPDGRPGDDYRPQIPEGEAVGYYHNHTLYGYFSSDDLALANLWNVDAYMTHQGSDYKYEHGADGEGGRMAPAPSDPLPGESSGEPHIVTFDRLSYDLQLAGELVAARSADGELELQVRQAPWRSRPVSVNSALALRIAGQRLTIGVAAPQVRLDGAPIGGDGAFVRVLARGGRIRRRVSAPDVIPRWSRVEVLWPQGDVLEAYIAERGFIDYALRPAPARRGTLRGLLGDADGDPDNDLRTPTGERLALPAGAAERHRLLHERFGPSWRVRAEASLFDYGPGESTAHFMRPGFPPAALTLAELDPFARRRAEAQARAAGIVAQPALDHAVFDLVVTGERQFLTLRRQRQGDAQHPGGELGFARARFASASDLALSGAAAVQDGLLRLTPARALQVGAAFHAQRLRVAAGFRCQIAFTLAAPGGIGDGERRTGGDGLALVIAAERPDVAGRAGLGLGYGGLPRSLAVELDTFKNTTDRSSSHVGVNTMGLAPNSHDDAQASLGAADTGELTDGQRHVLRIDYDGRTLTIGLDDRPKALLSVAVDLVARLGLRDGAAVVGLTASTGAAYQRHDVHSWSFEARR